MGRDGTYGDQFKLYVTANISSIGIIVTSTLGQQGLVDVLPENLQPLPQVLLGHFAKKQGFHYVVLEAEFISMEEQSDPLEDKNKKRLNSRQDQFGRK